MSLTDITPLTTVRVVTTPSSDLLPPITAPQPVLVLESGTRIVAGLGSHPSNALILDAISPAGSATRTTLLAENAQVQASHLGLVPDDAGGFAAVWAEGAISDQQRLFVQRYDAEGAATGTPVMFYDTGSVHPIQWMNGITVDRAGNIVIEVLDTPFLVGSPHTLTRYDLNGQQVGTPLNLPEPTATLNFNASQIAHLPDGGVSYGYGQEVFNPSGATTFELIVGVRAADGSDVIPPSVVHTYTGFELSPHIIHSRLNADGSLTAVYATDQTFFQSFGLQFIARTIATDGTVGNPVNLPNEALPEGFVAYLALDTGGFAQIMTQGVEGGRVPYLQMVDAQGNAEGSVQQLSGPIATTEIAAVLNDDGDIVLSARSGFTGLQQRRSPDSPSEIAVIAVIDPVVFQVLTEEGDSFALTEAGAVDGAGGNDTLTGSDENDRIIGGSGNDSIDAGAGDDVIEVLGIDTVNGGEGRDTAVMPLVEERGFNLSLRDDGAVIFSRLGVAALLTDVEDFILPMQGFSHLRQLSYSIEMLRSGGTPFDDRLQGRDAVDDLLAAGAGNDELFGAGGNDTLEAGQGRDTLHGGDGDDLLRGGDGVGDLIDVIYAGAGADTLDGSYGNDRLFGMDGDDVLLGGFGADTLAGQAGNDTLTGGAWGDEVSGNAGDDFLNGGFGSDRMNGGTGSDTFFHLGVTDHGNDWIQDFTSEDLLAFGSAGSRADFQINLATTEGAGSADVQEAFVIYRPTGQILWALVDGASADSIMLRVAGTEGPQTFDLLG